MSHFFVVFGHFWLLLVIFDHLRHSAGPSVGLLVGNTFLFCVVFCHFGSSGVILSHVFVVFGHFWLLLVIFGHF